MTKTKIKTCCQNQHWLIVAMLFGSVPALYCHLTQCATTCYIYSEGFDVLHMVQKTAVHLMKHKFETEVLKIFCLYFTFFSE